jgi:pyruvate-formate lyase-activating enzyme
VSALEAAALEAVRGALDLPGAQPLALVLEDAALESLEIGVRVGPTPGDPPGATLLALRGVHPDAQPARSIGLRRVQGGAAGRALLRRARAGLTRPPAELAPRLRTLLSALAAHLPYAGLRDEEFRKVSSAPMGAYGTLRLGYRCNQDCHFCWQDRAGAGPPPERVWGWLDEMAALGVRDLSLTGGEPTTWRELPALIERAHHVHGMRVSIQTNAIALSRPRTLSKLRAAGLAAISASYHSADAAVSDAMTAAPGTHAQTVAGIRAAIEAGLLVTLTCVVQRRNLPGLEAHARSIVERFVAPFEENRVLRATYAHPTSYAEPGGWQRHQVPFDVSGPPLRRAARILHAAGVPVQVTGTCGFPLCILADEPALLAQQPLRREQFDAGQLTHLAFAEECGGCARRGACFGLRQEYREAFGGRGLRPFPPGPAP